MKYLVCIIASAFLLTSCSSFFEKKQSQLTYYQGGDTKISFHGRFDFTEPLHPVFWAPGTYFELKFEGDYCQIDLVDNVRFGNHHNYIEIVLDDQKPKRIRLNERFNKIIIGDSLTDTIHKVLICKNTESGIGFIKLKGVKCRKLIRLPKNKKPIIEFIGNSITCGNGNDQSGLKCGEGKWYDQHNAYLSYGPLIARRFKADWVISAVSGIGLTRNCCGLENTMPEVYDRIAFSMNSERWLFTEKDPKILCITLGQNDGMQKESIYINTYLKFLRNLRKRYPNTTIICCSSPMANQRLRSHLEKCIKSVVKISKKQGENKVFFFFYRSTYNGGCDNHPTLLEHKQIAEELGNFIQKLKKL